MNDMIETPEPMPPPGMPLDHVQQIPVGEIIECKIGYADWNMVIIQSFEGEHVLCKTHGYQSTWYSHRMHYSHFKEWRRLNVN